MFLTCCTNTQHTERQQKLDHFGDSFIFLCVSFLILKFIVDRPEISFLYCSAQHLTKHFFEEQVFNSHGKFRSVFSGSRTALTKKSSSSYRNKSQVQMLGHLHDTSVLYQKSPPPPSATILFRSRIFFGMGKRNNTRRTILFRLRLCDHI